MGLGDGDRGPALRGAEGARCVRSRSRSRRSRCEDPRRRSVAGPERGVQRHAGEERQAGRVHQRPAHRDDGGPERLLRDRDRHAGAGQAARSALPEGRNGWRPASRSTMSERGRRSLHGGSRSTSCAATGCGGPSSRCLSRASRKPPRPSGTTGWVSSSSPAIRCSRQAAGRHRPADRLRRPHRRHRRLLRSAGGHPLEAHRALADAMDGERNAALLRYYERVAARLGGDDAGAHGEEWRASPDPNGGDAPAC